MRRQDPGEGPVRPRARQWPRDRSGAAAVEFAIVAPIFLALLFSIIEACWFFFVTASVEQATARAARLVRTGQAQASAAPITREAFYDEICKVVGLFGDCADRLTVDVARFDAFSDLAADAADPVCRDAEPETVDAIPYAPGGARDIVRVRICFLYRPVNPALGLDLRQAEDGSRKLMSVAIFRNEPFES